MNDEGTELIPKNPDTRTLAYLAVAVTSFFWGTTWVAAKIGLENVHPLTFASLRQGLGGLCFLVFFLLKGKAVLPTKKDWGYIIIMSLLLFVLSNGLSTWSVKYINGGLASIIGAIFPLWVAIIEWALGEKDKPGWLSITGIILGVVGVLIIFYEHLGDLKSNNFILGVLLSVGATVSWAFGTVYSTRKKITLNRFYSLGWQMFLSAVVLYIISKITGQATPISSIPEKTWGIIAYMVTFGSVIAFGAFIYSLQKLPTTLASVYAYLNPVVAVIVGHFLINEPWSLYLAIGAIVTLIGVYLVNKGFENSEK